ncbi:MAG TPA: glycerophosphodiester phosphodiesterase [Anaerolineaceae bacterium]|nr:glycerophosphodiester phosphodiesterase [Anaerolineaceae bacterium]
MVERRTLLLPGRFKPYVMAHRGNRTACPENTLASFRRAYADGADILETDLHLSADGVFMCIHDATVDRTTDGSGPVAEKTLAELKSLDASGGRVGFAGERIPTLQETAHSLPADVALALELKSDRFLDAEVCRRLATVLDETGIRARTVVLSFSLARVRAVQAAAPDVAAGWITASGYRPIGGVQLLGPYWPLLLANPLYVAVAHARGQLVCPLDPAPERRLWLYRLLGCDAVLTDDPEKTVRVLGRASAKVAAR